LGPGRVEAVVLPLSPIHRSSQKGRSQKFGCAILYGPRYRDEPQPLGPARTPVAEHNIWATCIKIRLAGCRASAVSRPSLSRTPTLLSGGESYGRRVARTDLELEGQGRCRNRRRPTRSRSRQQLCRHFLPCAEPRGRILRRWVSGVHAQSPTRVASSLAKLGRRCERHLPLLHPRL
jgi:hypothetical protein